MRAYHGGEGVELLLELLGVGGGEGRHFDVMEIRDVTLTLSLGGWRFGQVSRVWLENHLADSGAQSMHTSSQKSCAEC